MACLTSGVQKTESAFRGLDALQSLQGDVARVKLVGSNVGSLFRGRCLFC